MMQNYLEKVYAGFLGMNIGIRLGAPVEPTIWTYDRIYKTYGEITGYVKDFKNLSLVHIIHYILEFSIPFSLIIAFIKERFYKNV